jgi:type I restriction enzyme S subunit
MAAYHAIRDDGNETSQMNLNADIVGKFKVSIPPLNEQRQIVGYITPKLEKFDSMIDRAETAIALMQERRTALISAAVTGKIDVRDWQAAA